MNENKLSPELEKIFDEYENYFWNYLCECSNSDIERAVEIFRDALVDIDKIMKEKKMTEQEIKNIFKSISIEFKCDKCNKKILIEDSNIFACYRQLGEKGWKHKAKEIETPFDPFVFYTLCPDCLRKARQLEKHFGVFDLYKDNEEKNND